MAAIRQIARVALGAALIGAEVSHLTMARVEFRAQVPKFVPIEPDTAVDVSGIKEILLGALLVLT